MRKRVKRLTLSRETIRSLQTAPGQVAGGESTDYTCIPQPMATDCACQTQENNCLPYTACLMTCSCGPWTEWGC